jgi:hypothetical protein
MTANCRYATAARSGRHLSKLFWRNREGVRKKKDNGSTKLRTEWERNTEKKSSQ